MNREQAIAALGGIEKARDYLRLCVHTQKLSRNVRDNAIEVLALSDLDAPAGDGWAALERLREATQHALEANRRTLDIPEIGSNFRERTAGRECAYSAMVREIDRELAARPADAPSSHIASPAHVALWDAINAFTVASGGSASNTSTARQVAVASVEKALRQMERERDACCDDYQREAARAVKAEAEVARLQALVADVAKDMAKAIALMEATK